MDLILIQLSSSRCLACLAHMIAALPMRRAEEPLTLIAAANSVVARRSETVLAALRESGEAKVRLHTLAQTQR